MTHRGVAACVAALGFWAVPLVAQAPLETRISRLERQVNELRALHGLDTTGAPQRAAAAVETPAELRGNDNVGWGYPGGRGVVLVKEHFVILHDNERRQPTWVAYHLTSADLEGQQPRTGNFRADPALPVGQRAEPEDYSHTGYDRGHMAPAADFKRSYNAMSETFLLSNIAPQRPNLNQGTLERLESQVRSLAQTHGSVWVVTGALYLDSAEAPAEPRNFIGPNRFPVPTHFYKVLLCEHPDGRHEMFAFVMSNALDVRRGQPSEYVATVDRVERLSGLDFFAALPDEEEDRLEALLNDSWPPR